MSAGKVHILDSLNSFTTNIYRGFYLLSVYDLVWMRAMELMLSAPASSMDGQGLTIWLI